MLAVVARRDAVHQPGGGLGFGELPVGQARGGGQYLAMRGVEFPQEVGPGLSLAGLHEAGVPAIEIVVGTVRIRSLPAAQPFQRRDHLPMPARGMRQDLAHTPGPEPDLAHLGFVEALDGRLEPVVLLLGLLQQLLLGSHGASHR